MRSDIESGSVEIKCIKCNDEAWKRRREVEKSEQLHWKRI